MPALLTTAQCPSSENSPGPAEGRVPDKIGRGSIFALPYEEEAVPISPGSVRRHCHGEGYVDYGEKSVVINNAVADFFIGIATTGSGRPGGP
jgi:hypothetical protein